MAKRRRGRERGRRGRLSLRMAVVVDEGTLLRRANLITFQGGGAVNSFNSFSASENNRVHISSDIAAKVLQLAAPLVFSLATKSHDEPLERVIKGNRCSPRFAPGEDFIRHRAAPLPPRPATSESAACERRNVRCHSPAPPRCERGAIDSKQQAMVSSLRQAACPKLVEIFRSPLLGPGKVT